MSKLDNERVSQFCKERALPFRYCFCIDSTDKWIEIFACKRFARLFDSDMITDTEKSLEIEFTSEKLKREFKEIYLNVFKEVIHEYQDQLREEARAKAKEKKENKKK